MLAWFPHKGCITGVPCTVCRRSIGRCDCDADRGTNLSKVNKRGLIGDADAVDKVCGKTILCKREKISVQF